SGWKGELQGLTKAIEKANNCQVITEVPQAESRNVSLFNGMKTYAWFDIYGISPDITEDVDGIKEASSKLEKLIDYFATKHSIPHKRIVLGGFSQGGALALIHCILTKKELGGLIVHSSFLPCYKDYLCKQKIDKKSTPTLFIHGKQDPTVLYDYGYSSYKASLNYLSNIKFLSFENLGHSADIK
ncbi:MAG: acyl-protein thioesterase, partial [Paramarteilia canceri]